MSEQSKWDELMDDLARQRDELRLKIHLGQAEAREEWDKVEAKWEDLQAKLGAAGREAADASRGVGSALRLLGDEIARGYQRVRQKLD